jgi:AcrR family transcriptional regulator
MSDKAFLRARNEAERSQRQQALLQAGKQLFEEGGWEAVTMAKVAALAGVAKGTTYLYFPTKEALFLQLLLLELDPWLQELIRRMPDKKAPRKTARLFARSLGARPLLVRLLAALHSTLEAGADPDTVLAFKRQLLQKLAPAVAGLEQALDTPEKGLKLFLYTHALVVGMAQLSQPPAALQAVLNEPPYSVLSIQFEQDLAEALSRLFVGAVQER